MGKNLYPELSEEGQKEAQALIDSFKEKLKAITSEVLGDLYCDVAVFIESDSWTNYRNKIMGGMRDYGNKDNYQHDFKAIRQKIYEDFREDIIKDLNQDLLDEVESLKKQLEFERSIHDDQTP